MFLFQLGCATVVVLGHVFPAACRFVMLAAIFSFFFFFLGSVGNVSRVFCAYGFVAFLIRFGLGFRWCLAVSGRLPTSFIFVFVPARLRDGCCFRTCLSSGLQICDAGGYFFFFFFFLGSVGNVSRVFCLRFRSVLIRFGLGFRWCLAVSGRLPTSFIFVFVPARLRDGCCFRTCLSSGL